MEKKIKSPIILHTTVCIKLQIVDQEVIPMNRQHKIQFSQPRKPICHMLQAYGMNKIINKCDFLHWAYGSD